MKHSSRRLLPIVWMEPPDGKRSVRVLSPPIHQPSGRRRSLWHGSNAGCILVGPASRAEPNPRYRIADPFEPCRHRHYFIRWLFRGRRFTDAIKVVQSPDENLSSRDGWRSVTLFIELILVDHLEFIARLEDEHDAVVIQEIQMAICQHWRGTVMLAQFLLP